MVNCPICGERLEVHDPSGLYRFRCPKGVEEYGKGGDIEHTYFM